MEFKELEEKCSFQMDLLLETKAQFKRGVFYLNLSEIKKENLNFLSNKSRSKEKYKLDIRALIFLTENKGRDFPSLLYLRAFILGKKLVSSPLLECI